MSEERWRELCEAIMKETDPGKLLRLVEALNNELGRREGELKHARTRPESNPGDKP